MAVSFNEILCYHLNENNTNSDLFIKFIKDLFNKIPEECKKNKLVIMDNEKFHLTKNVRKICEEYKIKLITISPYNSAQNMIELIFRLLKNILKRFNFKTIKNLENKIVDLIEGEEIKKILIKLYKSTLLYYKRFFEKNTELEKYKVKFKNIIDN